MLVATADLGSMPNWSMAGTVMREVLPVTTLTMLVRKKTILSATIAQNNLLRLLRKR